MSQSDVFSAEAWRKPDRVVARFPFFYGWAILPMTMLAQIATSPGQTFGVAFFNASFRRDLGLTTTQIATAYMLGTLVASLPIAYVGRLMDRYGIRRTMFVVVLLFGAACMLTSQVSGIVSLFAAFVLLRLLGQGALSLLAGNTMAMWFHARLGTVTGLMSVGMAGAMAIVPPFFLYLIDTYRWRGAYIILGLLIWVILLPMLAVFFRNRPEDIGQQTDGRREPGNRSRDELRAERTAMDPAGDFELSAALRTRAYWIMLIMTATWGMIGTAIIFHITGLFEVRGLSEAHAAATFSTFAIAMAVMQLIGGVLADRLPLNLLMAVAVSVMTVCMCLLAGGQADWTVPAYAGFGAAQGMLGAVSNTAWPRYFGRAHLGKIRGTVMTVVVAGTGLGPFCLGGLYDLLGSYAPTLWTFAAIYSAVAVSTLFATPPGRNAVRQHSTAH